MPLRTDRVVVRYEITFEAPFHCGTGLPRRLVDRSVQRDATGYLFVPGSTIKGLVREACERDRKAIRVESASPHDEQAAIRELRALIGFPVSSAPAYTRARFASMMHSSWRRTGRSSEALAAEPTYHSRSLSERRLASPA